MMSYDIMIAVSNFSLFTFLGILVSSSSTKERLKNNAGILLSSFLMFISNSFLYFEIKKVVNNSPSIFLTFVTYTSLFWAIFLLVHLIRSLYSNNSVLNIKVFVIQGFFSGIILTILAYFEASYLIRTISFGAILTGPVLKMIYFLVKNNIQIFKNVFFYQFSVVAILFLFKVTNIILFEPDAYFDNVSKRDTLFTMLSIIVLITIFTAYLIEKQNILYSELNSKTSIIKNNLIKVKNMSETDQLTGLSNRYKINEDLKVLAKRYKVFSEEFSIIMCDINDFKDINDTFGHNVGDEVLKFTSYTLDHLLRDKDIVGRWGGDEFILILPETGKDYISSILSKINTYFSLNNCSSINNNLSLAMGSSTYDSNFNIQELIHKADLDMYKNKNNLKTI